MYRVTKRFQFEAAHRLPKHSGKCQHLHGHTYVAEVTVEAKELNADDMVVDFGVINSTIGKFIEESWDHALLCQVSDGQAPKVARRYGFLLQPTAEVMAKQLFDIVTGRLLTEVVRVRIYETPDSWADYFPDSE